jgi:hypothetical protein
LSDLLGLYLLRGQQMLETVTIGTATLHLGDCREMLATLRDQPAVQLEQGTPQQPERGHRCKQSDERQV